jgi:hypothetical protein
VSVIVSPVIEPEHAAAQLRDAIERVYAAFAHCRLPAVISYCGHCVTAEENDVLLTVPLRQLTADQLRRYAWKALSTWGDPADFQHFLPRLLELLVTGELDDPALPERFVGKVLIYGSGWPDEAQAAVRSLLDAWWVDTVARYPAPFTAATVLEALQETGYDPRRYLVRWDGSASEASIRQLADFLQGWPNSSILDDEWTRAITEWIRSGVPSQILEAAKLHASDPAIAAEFAEAYKYADWIQRSFA